MGYRITFLILTILAEVFSMNCFSSEIPKDVFDKEQEVIRISKNHIINNLESLNLIIGVFNRNKELSYIDRAGINEVSAWAFDTNNKTKLVPFNFESQNFTSQILEALDSIRVTNSKRHNNEIHAYAGDSRTGNYLMKSNLVYLSNETGKGLRCLKRESYMSFRACSAHLSENWYLNFSWYDTENF